MATHKCNKEKEIATMTEKIANIERKVDEIHKNMTSFIDKADIKYASNSRVDALENILVKQDNRIWRIAKDVAIYGALIMVLAKQFSLI